MKTENKTNKELQQEIKYLNHVEKGIKFAIKNLLEENEIMSDKIKSQHREIQKLKLERDIQTKTADFFQNISTTENVFGNECRRISCAAKRKEEKA